MRLQQYIDVGQSKDVASFKAGLVSFAHELEFEFVTACLMIETPGLRPRYFRVDNTPQAFLKASISNADAARDPLLKQLRTASVPIIYNQDTYVHGGAADLWEQQAPHGYHTGICVALHMQSSRHFLLGVDRPQSLPSNETHLTRMMADLQLLAVHAQDAAVRILGPMADAAKSPLHLTPREREILRWTREGKSAWAVGEILSVSENTVIFHLRNIMRKTGTSSKHSAVLQAVELGLI